MHETQSKHNFTKTNGADILEDSSFNFQSSALGEMKFKISTTMNHQCYCNIKSLIACVTPPLKLSNRMFLRKLANDWIFPNSSHNVP